MANRAMRSDRLSMQAHNVEFSCRVYSGGKKSFVRPAAWFERLRRRLRAQSIECVAVDGERWPYTLRRNERAAFEESLRRSASIGIPSDVPLTEACPQCNGTGDISIESVYFRRKDVGASRRAARDPRKNASGADDCARCGGTGSIAYACATEVDVHDLLQFLTHAHAVPITIRARAA